MRVIVPPPQLIAPRYNRKEGEKDRERKEIEIERDVGLVRRAVCVNSRVCALNWTGAIPSYTSSLCVSDPGYGICIFGE